MRATIALASAAYLIVFAAALVGLPLWPVVSVVGAVCIVWSWPTR